MGTYVVFCCHERREFIDPGDVNDGAIKLGDVTYRGDLGRLLIFLMTDGHEPYGRGVWRAVSCVADSSSEHDLVFRYTDVTAVAIDAFNERYPDGVLSFTGEPPSEVLTAGVELTDGKKRLGQ